MQKTIRLDYNALSSEKKLLDARNKAILFFKSLPRGSFLHVFPGETHKHFSIAIIKNNSIIVVNKKIATLTGIKLTSQGKLVNTANYSNIGLAVKKELNKILFGVETGFNTTLVTIDG